MFCSVVDSSFVPAVDRFQLAQISDARSANSEKPNIFREMTRHQPSKLPMPRGAEPTLVLDRFSVDSAKNDALSKVTESAPTRFTPACTPFLGLAPVSTTTTSSLFRAARRLSSSVRLTPPVVLQTSGFDTRVAKTHPQIRTMSSITIDTINQNVKDMQYAVRGAIVSKAGEIEQALKADPTKYPFDKIVMCNIGNPQSLGQKPITFYRQVLALCDFPEMLESKEAETLFPVDVREKAKAILQNMKGGTGAYSESKGVSFLRKMVADGIEKRDGHPCDIEDLWLTDGASVGCHYLMKTLIRDANDAVLVPIPQYPLYSATLALYGGTLLPYYLQEDKGWALDVGELKTATDKARSEGKNVRALVVINPGNPTGAALDLVNQQEVVSFCGQEGLLLVADEVYQENVYAEGKSFTSFKKVMRDMKVDIPLASLQSTSKGFYGECGRRGGYMELNGFDPLVKDQLYKLSSVGLCPNLGGQIVMGLVMAPPVEGDPSYPKFKQEKDDILASLKRRAATLVVGLNALEGVTCNPAQGSMYAFPKITLPTKHIEEASTSGMAPDALYCMKLLEATGIVVVPGSGFGQRKDTWHFRTTFLPAEADIADVVQKITKYHGEFMESNK